MPARKKNPEATKKRPKKMALGKRLNGFFGPGKKAIRATGLGLIRQGKKTLHSNSLLTENAINRMSIKYSLDTLNIRDMKKRKTIHELFREAAKQSKTAGLHGRNVPVSSINLLSDGLTKVIGPAKTMLLLKLVTRKSKRLEKIK